MPWHWLLSLLIDHKLGLQVQAILLLYQEEEDDFSVVKASVAKEDVQPGEEMDKISTVVLVLEAMVG